MPDIKIEGLDALQKKLGEVAAMAYMGEVLMAAGSQLKNYIAKYPPFTDANVPNQRRWYQRGWGTKWLRKDGSVNGVQSSETLGRRWTVSPRGPLEVVVGNNASYAPYVQSAEKQAHFHKSRGWRTDQMAIEKTTPAILKLVQQTIDKKLAGG